MAAIFLIVHQSHLSDKEFKKQLSELSAKFTCTAHTGCMDTEENSIEAIEAGIKNCAQIVEFDLNFNQNKEPVLSHDSPVGG